MEKNWRETRQEKFDRENTVRYSIKLNKHTDREIIDQVERMTGTVKDPKTGELWTTHGAIRHLLYTAAYKNPKLITFMHEASKLTPEQLQAVIELVNRINARENGEAVANEIMARQ